MDPFYVMGTVVNGLESVAQKLKDKNIAFERVKCISTW